MQLVGLRNKSRLLVVGVILVFQFICIPTTNAAKVQSASMPETKFVLIGNMEHSQVINNLSMQGLYHSLLFASYLYDKGLPSKNVTAMYALFDVNYLSHGLPDLAPLQAIEYYSVYRTAHHNGIITGALKHSLAMSCSSNSNCKVVNNLITSSTGTQIYVFSMPNEDINALLTALQPGYDNFKFDPILLGSTGDYVVLNASNKSITAQTFHDAMTPPNSYPTIPKSLSNDINFIKDIGLLKNGSATSKYAPKASGLNKNETVYLVRHVEKFADTGEDVHPDDGNYGCLGEWRAIFKPDLINQIVNNVLPDYLYAPNPTVTYGAANYIRATMSISPYAIKFNKGETLAPIGIGINGDKMYQYLFHIDHGGFSGPDFNNKTVFVSWESANIKKIMADLAADYADDPNNTRGGIMGSGRLGGFDNVIKIVIDSKGNVTIESLYEGISFGALRSTKTCPTWDSNGQ